MPPARGGKNVFTRLPYNFKDKSGILQHPNTSQNGTLLLSDSEKITSHGMENLFRQFCVNLPICSGFKVKITPKNGQNQNFETYLWTMERNSFPRDETYRHGHPNLEF